MELCFTVVLSWQEKKKAIASTVFLQFVAIFAVATLPLNSWLLIKRARISEIYRTVVVAVTPHAGDDDGPPLQALPEPAVRGREGVHRGDGGHGGRGLELALQLRQADVVIWASAL